MPLNRRKKLLLVGGIIIVVMLMFVAYYTTKSSTPAAKPWGTSPAGSAPGTGGTTPTSYIPPSPSYQPVGDSTADGTPVDGTAPSVPSDPVQTGGSTSGSATGGSADESPAAGVSPTQEPSVIVDCAMQKNAILAYYKLKTSQTLIPSMISVNAVSDTTCDAGFALSEPGSTTVKSVDSRRFIFGKTGIASMGGSLSGSTITLPTIVPPITTAVEAPPTSLITDYGKYFKKFAGNIWQTIASSSVAPSVDACQKICYDRAGCTGINYQPATGRCSTIANTGSPVLTMSAGDDFYQRIPTKTVVPVFGSQIAAGDTTDYLSQFTQTVGKYFATGDLTSFNTNNAADCAASCSKDYTCSGFNYWAPTYKCETVRGYTGQPLSTHSAASFYRRNTPGVAPAPVAIPTTRPLAYGDELTRFQRIPDNRITSAFFTYPNVRNGLYNGIQVSTDGTPAGCAKVCYDDITCRGFNINKTNMSCNLITTDVYPYPTTTGTTGWDAYMLYDSYGYAPQVEPTPVAPTVAPAPATSVDGGVSTNERCGPNWGNTKCPQGLCCSNSDWCGPAVGTTTAWCSSGGRGRDGGIYDGV